MSSWPYSWGTAGGKHLELSSAEQREWMPGPLVVSPAVRADPKMSVIKGWLTLH